MPEQTLDDLARLVASVIRTQTGRVVTLTPSDSLVYSGLLDSMSLVQLVHALREECGAELQPGDLVAENFETVTAIATLLARSR